MLRDFFWGGGGGGGNHKTGRIKTLSGGWQGNIWSYSHKFRVMSNRESFARQHSRTLDVTKGSWKEIRVLHDTRVEAKGYSKLIRLYSSQSLFCLTLIWLKHSSFGLLCESQKQQAQFFYPLFLLIASQAYNSCAALVLDWGQEGSARYLKNQPVPALICETITVSDHEKKTC